MSTKTAEIYRTDRIFANDTRYRRTHETYEQARRRCDRSDAPCSIEVSRDGGKTWNFTC